MTNKNKVLQENNPELPLEKMKSRNQDSHPPYLKGQMFILAAILIVGGIVLIFNVLGAPLITEEKRYQDTRLLDKNAKNILNEYIFVLGIATLDAKANESASKYLTNLSSYIRDELDSTIFYTVVFGNGTNQRYSVNIGNYLNRKINVTVNVTNSTPSSGAASLDDKTNSTLYFASNINGTINITVSYKKGNEEITEKFPVTVSAKNFIQGFFDIIINDGRSGVNVKEIYNRTW